MKTNKRLKLNNGKFIQFNPENWITVATYYGDSTGHYSQQGTDVNYAQEIGGDLMVVCESTKYHQNKGRNETFLTWGTKLYQVELIDLFYAILSHRDCEITTEGELLLRDWEAYEYGYGLTPKIVKTLALNMENKVVVTNHY